MIPNLRNNFKKKRDVTLLRALPTPHTKSLPLDQIENCVSWLVNVKIKDCHLKSLNQSQDA